MQSPETAALCSNDRSCALKRSRALFQLEKLLVTNPAYESFSHDVVGRDICILTAFSQAKQKTQHLSIFVIFDPVVLCFLTELEFFT